MTVSGGFWTLSKGIKSALIFDLLIVLLVYSATYGLQTALSSMFCFQLCFSYWIMDDVVGVLNVGNALLLLTNGQHLLLCFPVLTLSHASAPIPTNRRA